MQYRYYVHITFEDNETNTQHVHATSPANALNRALDRLRYDYDRYDIRGVRIVGDPIPQEQRARKRAIKAAKEEYKKKYTWKYDGLTRIREEITDEDQGDD